MSILPVSMLFLLRITGKMPIGYLCGSILHDTSFMCFVCYKSKLLLEEASKKPFRNNFVKLIVKQLLWKCNGQTAMDSCFPCSVYFVGW